MLVRDVTLEVEEKVNLCGQLYLPDGEAPYPAVCICHGIPAGGIHDPNDPGYPALVEKICANGFAVFFFGFRGTAGSGGDFDILGWVKDLKGVIDYLCSVSEVDRKRLAVLGFSGGAAVSVYVAAGDKRVSALIACACPAEFTLLKKADRQATIDRFRSIGLFRSEGFPRSVEEWFRGFEEVCPVRYIGRIAPRPLLLVHGSGDDVVPPNHARRLYDKAGEPKELVIVEGAGHRLRQDERAMSVVIDWLKSWRPKA